MNGSIARNLRALLLVVSPLVLPCPAMASDQSVPAGCDALSDGTGGRTFYIDPLHGSMANDGSAARPWRTFAEVVAQSSHLISSRGFSNYRKDPNDLQPINPDGPIKPGDRLVLMSGDHGAVDLRQYQNAKFIQVVAGANQTPVISSMRALSTTHWLFKGIKFQGLRPQTDPWGAMVEVAENDLFGPGGDLIFTGNSFSAEEDSSGWSDADWVNRPYSYGLRATTACTTLSGNHFYNVHNAASVAGNNNIVIDNLVERVGNDGFDIMSSNLIVRHNVVKDGHHTPAEPLHADGIQGWTLKDATNRNVVIDSNTIINLSQSDDNYMQGISIFDGKWDGLKVINNVVITNTWHGIALYGVHNAEVINNTVLPSRIGKYMTWITIHASKDKSPSTNVVVRNNIAGDILANGENIAIDHNLVLNSVSPLKIPEAGASSSDVTFAYNQSGLPVEAIVKTFDMAAQAFDLRLPSNSAARESGSDQGAPAVDIEGRPRKRPIDIGAFAR